MIVQTRAATIDDIENLVPLLTELFAQDIEFIPDESAQRRGLSKILANPDIGTILVSVLNGEVIGMINILYTVSTAKGSTVAIFEDMIITSKHHGNGYGSQLVSFGIDYVRKQNISRITLLTDFDNSNAIAFYEKHGFSKSVMVPYRLQLIDG